MHIYYDTKDRNRDLNDLIETGKTGEAVSRCVLKDVQNAPI